ncbi:MAG: hypothetical protein JWL63_2682 [Rhodocyclales bacterium]|nr:hypothetical protein [Rhodocyclales bacterium]
MSISWGNRVIADTTFKGLHGRQVVGEYGGRFSIGFEVKNWTEDGPLPHVALSHAPVTLSSGLQTLVGFAVPECVCPFNAGAHSYSTAALFDLVLTQRTIEGIEVMRGGGDISLSLKIQGLISRAEAVQQIRDEVTCTIGQSDWLRFLNECGYGRSMLFEIPLPSKLDAAPSTTQEALLRAREQFLQGHYQESIGTCRRVLESLTHELDQSSELETVKRASREERQSMSITGRELAMRLAAINYSHPAHHADHRGSDTSFDRLDASMLLGVTASLAATALSRHRSANRSNGST